VNNIITCEIKTKVVSGNRPEADARWKVCKSYSEIGSFIIYENDAIKEGAHSLFTTARKGGML